MELSEQLGKVGTVSGEAVEASFSELSRLRESLLLELLRGIPVNKRARIWEIFRIIW